MRQYAHNDSLSTAAWPLSNGEYIETNGFDRYNSQAIRYSFTMLTAERPLVSKLSNIDIPVSLHHRFNSRPFAVFRIVAVHKLYCE